MTIGAIAHLDFWKWLCQGPLLKGSGPLSSEEWQRDFSCWFHQGKLKWQLLLKSYLGEYPFLEGRGKLSVGELFHLRSSLSSLMLATLAWNHLRLSQRINDKNIEKSDLIESSTLIFKKLEEMGAYQREDLYDLHQENFPLDLEGEKDIGSSVLQKIEFAYEEKSIISWTDSKQEEKKSFVHRIFFHKGELHIVLENAQGGELSILSLDHIHSIHYLKQKEENQEQFSIRRGHGEIEKFLEEWLSWDENALTRIVLRVKDPDLSMKPFHHHLGSSYETHNHKGERIWAATLDLCDDFFAWLAQYQEMIEVIDPPFVRDMLKNFIDERQEIEHQSSLNLLKKKKAS